jgi:rhodanese-related sulfurtransferase
MDYATDDVRGGLPGAVLVEALGAPYYRSGHLPGAVNIPPHLVPELAPRLLPDKDVVVVVYGAHQRCAHARIVLRKLAELGYRRLARYPGGKEAWAEAGLPLVP